MAQFDLSVSGGFHLTVDGQPVRPFRTDKARALLTYLAMESDRPHQRQALAALFWPEMASVDALRNLRKTLYLIRQIVADPQLAASLSVPMDLLTISRQAVQLNPVGITVDMIVFRERVQSVAQHPHQFLHLCQPCLARLRQAVTLYRDDFLAGFSLPDSLAFEGWALTWQEHLHALARQSLHQLAIAHALRGEFVQAQADAIRQVELDPYSEEAVQDLMRILAQSGQRVESLAVYERMEALLGSEMDMAPDVRSTDLRDVIQAEMGWQVVPEALGPLGLETRYTNFVGRTNQIVQIQEKLLDPTCRLLTLLGPGGMGKSRLAATVAKLMATNGIFPDGVLSVPALGVATPGCLLAMMAEGLKLMEPDQASIQDVIESLASRRCLIVVDDLEPSIPVATCLVELLANAPELSLLVTARQPLYVRAEHQLRIGGLGYPTLADFDACDQPVAQTVRHGAVQLFIQSAQQAQLDFALTQANQRQVVRICNLVEGMPLALKIAAGWVRLMPCAVIAHRLADPETTLDFLTSPLHDLPQRHRSIIALFDHAWCRLTPQEQQTLARLSSLPAPFDLEIAMSGTDTTVNTTVNRTIDMPIILASLLDKSMLQQSADRRLFLPALLRQYVLRQVAHLDSTGLPEA